MVIDVSYMKGLYSTVLQGKKKQTVFEQNMVQLIIPLDHGYICKSNQVNVITSL